MPVSTVVKDIVEDLQIKKEKNQTIVGERNPDDFKLTTPVNLGDMDSRRTEGVDAAFDYLEKNANPGTSFGGIVLAAIAFASGLISAGLAVWAMKIGC